MRRTLSVGLSWGPGSQEEAEEMEMRGVERREGQSSRGRDKRKQNRFNKFFSRFGPE